VSTFLLIVVLAMLFNMSLSHPSNGEWFDAWASAFRGMRNLILIFVGCWMVLALLWGTTGPWGVTNVIR